MATAGQISTLVKAGYTLDELKNLTTRDASKWIDTVKSFGWRRPTTALIEHKIAREAGLEVRALRRAILAPEVNDKELDKLFAEHLTLSEQAQEEEDRSELKKVSKQSDQITIDLGRILMHYKQTYCQHGEWLPFLSILGIPPQTAQRYMRVAGLKSELPPGMESLLARENVHITPRMSTENRQIASKAADKARERLEAKCVRTDVFASEPVDGWDLDDGLLTMDELEECVKEAIQEVRPDKTVDSGPDKVPSASPGRPATDDSFYSEAAQQGRYEAQLRESLLALKNLYGKNWAESLHTQIVRVVPEVFYARVSSPATVAAR